MKKTTIYQILLITLCIVLVQSKLFSQTDSSFFSIAFDTERSYRIYLPADYDENLEKEYPVVYYFHGWGGRYKWDNYTLSDDPFYPGNGRKEPPFVMEWRDYVNTHDLIIVTWDGYEPNLAPGSYMLEGIPYGNCDPYDYPRAHESPVKHWGWDYKMYFRDLVAHIDGSYRTIPDRDHRGVTGLSMGGLSALYISGQNKDLVGSISAFCPADNIPMYGPKGHLSVFPVLEMYRSMKGLSMRLSANDGDWLYANDIEMKRIFEGTGFEPFEFHLADFPDHWTADADKQLDFHMAEFSKEHARPAEWDHICPAFKSFDQWGYEFTVERSTPALTILGNVSERHMKIVSRKFIPDGPIVQDETVTVRTDSLYEPDTEYKLISYNLTKKIFSTEQQSSSPDGRLEFSLPGGGHFVGINGDENTADLNLLDINNRDYYYFEEGRDYSLKLNLVNLGSGDASDISIEAYSDHPHINFAENEIIIPGLASGEGLELDSAFRFQFTGYNKEYLAGNIILKIKTGTEVAGTQKLVFFTTPVSPYAKDNDIIILDGKFVDNVPMFLQGKNRVEKTSISGGRGNGNGIPEPGEDIMIYVRLAQGLAPNDKDAFHKTYLFEDNNDPYIQVNSLKYQEKKAQASTTSILSVISLSDTVPVGHPVDLLFRVESLYNDYDVPASRRHTYRFDYDYRRVSFSIMDTSTTSTSEIKLPVSGLRIEEVYPNPFTESIQIRYYQEKEMKVSMSIYNVNGKRIRNLKNWTEEQGEYLVEWDGKNGQNESTPPGIYFYKLQSGDDTLSGRMIKL